MQTSTRPSSSTVPPSNLTFPSLHTPEEQLSVSIHRLVPHPISSKLYSYKIQVHFQFRLPIVTSISISSNSTLLNALKVLNGLRPSRFRNKWSLPFLQSSFHSRVVLQMTPASSACVLPAVFMSNVQSISLFWVVSQTTLFRKIGPVPWPKAALLRG